MEGRRRGFRAYSATSYSKVEVLARQVRDRLDIPATGPIPGVRLFEGLFRCEVIVAGLAVPLSPSVESLPTGVEGVTRYEPEEGRITVALSLESYRGLEREEPRSRFSVCHEIGHAVQHARELLDWSSDQHHREGLRRGVPTPHPDYYDTEWQANSFAAALLMPARGLLKLQGAGQLYAGEMQGHFGVSRESAQIRLRVFSHRQFELLR